MANARALLQLLDVSHQQDSRKFKPRLAMTACSTLLPLPKLLPGETLILQLQCVCCYDTLANGVASGLLHLTDYKLVFTGNYVTFHDETTDIPESGEQEVEPERVARRGWKSQKVKQRKQRKRVKQPFSTFLNLGPRKQMTIAREKSDSLFYPMQSQTFSLSPRSLRRAHISQGIVASALSPSHGSRMVSVALEDLKVPVTDPISQIDSEAPQYEVELTIPLTGISVVKKGPGLVLSDEGIKLDDVLRVICSTGQLYKFGLQAITNYKVDNLQDEIKKLMAPQYFARLFAFCYRNALSSSLNPELLEESTTPNFYSLEGEIERMKMTGSQIWRIAQLPVSLCTTYPHEIIVPSCVSDIDVIRVAAFHRCHRLPAICWQHTANGAIMLRAAGTTSRRGKAGTRLEADEGYLHAVCMLSSSSLQDAKLWIFTDRPLTSGSKPTTSRKLSRDEANSYYYPGCRFVYSYWDPEVETYKAARTSFKQLQLLMHSNVEFGRYLSALEETEWLNQIHQLLQTAVSVALAVDEFKSSVLIAYENGWDRTPQVTSLAQLLLDPYYRTFDGFQVLIQKEWLSFGHKFTSRHAAWLTKGKEDGPVFLQWLDCVWQVLRQFPRQFEFNERFLQVLAEHSYSSRFGSFLMDSDRERSTQDLHQGTVSLWRWLYLLIQTNSDFTNKLYEPECRQRVLYPQTNTACLKLWTSQYCGYKQEENLWTAEQMALEQKEKLLKDYKELKRQYATMCEGMGLTAEDSLARIVPEAAGMLSSSSHSSSWRLLLKHHLGPHEQTTLEPDDMYRRSKRVDDDEAWNSLVLKKKGFCHQTLCEEEDLSRQFTEDELEEDDNEEKVEGGEGQHQLNLVDSLNKLVLSSQSVEEESTLKSPEVFLPEVDLVSHVKMKGLTTPDINQVRLNKSTCFGYLSKIGGRHKAWRKRWFVLDMSKHFLAYFEDAKAAERKQAPRGVIKLVDVQELYSYTKKDNAFAIKTPKRTYLIQAPSVEAMETWIACLTVGNAGNGYR